MQEGVSRGVESCAEGNFDEYVTICTLIADRAVTSGGPDRVTLEFHVEFRIFVASRVGA